MIESLFALVIGLVGAVLNTPTLKEITWSSEMKHRRVRLPFPCGPVFTSAGTEPLKRWTLASALPTSTTKERNYLEVNADVYTGSSHVLFSYREYLFCQDVTQPWMELAKHRPRDIVQG